MLNYRYFFKHLSLHDVSECKYPQQVSEAGHEPNLKTTKHMSNI